MCGVRAVATLNSTPVKRHTYTSCANLPSFSTSFGRTCRGRMGIPGADDEHPGVAVWHSRFVWEGEKKGKLGESTYRSFFFSMLYKAQLCPFDRPTQPPFPIHFRLCNAVWAHVVAHRQLGSRSLLVPSASTDHASLKST